MNEERRPPTASVVVAARNAAATIDEALTAIAAQRWDEPWEVIVSDNGSTDDTRARVERYRDELPHLVVVDSSERSSAGHARDVGAGHARADLLVFADADDVVAPGWLAAATRALAEHDLVVCRLEFARLNPPWARATRSGHQEHGPMEWWLGDYLPFGYGGTLAVRRDWHERVGGFHGSMGLSEDIDYCWRLQQAGATLGFEARALVHYRLRQTTVELFRQAWRYGESWPRLYHEHAAKGLPPPDRSPLGIAKGWARAFRHAPLAFRKDRRARLAWDVGERVGMLRGSVRHRTIVL